MLKKLFVVLLLLLLTSCSSSIDQEIDTDIYLEAINDVDIFSMLDEDTSKRIKMANNDKDYDNYQFKMLNKDVFSDELFDIYGNAINLSDYDNLILEVVSTECEHCKVSIENCNDKLNEFDVKVVQYFNVGSKDEILKLYEQLKIDVSENITIVSHDDRLNDYLKDYLHLKMYPSILCFKDDKLSFTTSGEFTAKQLADIYDIAFVKTLNIDEKLIASARDQEDVEASFKKENLEKLNTIDNDGHSKEYTCRLVGNSLDYDKISKKVSDVYINEIEDYSLYKDKDVVLIYTYLNEGQVDRVEFINSLIDDERYEYIVVLIEGLDSSSSAYNKMRVKFNCKVTSILGYTPDDFFKIGISKYPTAFFVEKGTYTDAYSNIDDVDSFKYALDIFFGEDSISLKANN